MEAHYSPSKCISCVTIGIRGHPNPCDISTGYVERQKSHDVNGCAPIHAVDQCSLKEDSEP